MNKREFIQKFGLLGLATYSLPHDIIYDKKIVVEFLSWIRNPKDFKDKLELKNQLNKDEKKCRKFLLK